MKHYYFMNKTTGELVTYSQANREFYATKRTYLESIFDEYTETTIESDETVEFPDFTQVLAR